MTEFLPHRYCYLNNWALVWTIVLSDLLIGVSYSIIGFVLYRLAARAGVGGWMLWAFATFIAFCGLGHYIDVITVFRGWYFATAFIRIMTAAASVATCAAVLVVYTRLAESQEADG